MIPFFPFWFIWRVVATIVVTVSPVRCRTLYETRRVAPLSLLVPVVGLASAAVLLDETLTGLQLLGWHY